MEIKIAGDLKHILFPGRELITVISYSSGKT